MGPIMTLQDIEEKVDTFEEIKEEPIYLIFQAIHGLLDLAINNTPTSRLRERLTELNIKVMVKLQKYEEDNA
jgi:hypothetical protein